VLGLVGGRGTRGPVSVIEPRSGKRRARKGMNGALAEPACLPESLALIPSVPLVNGSESVKFCLQSVFERGVREYEAIR